MEPKVEGKSVIIQGFGNVGSWGSKFFSNAGSKVIGITEWNSGVYDPNGLDIAKLLAHWGKNKTFKGF